VPLVNVVIYRQLIPRHEALTCDAPILSNRDIGSFLAWDYFGALCLLATGSLVPVVVAAQLDVRQAAYFYMAWFIAVFADAIGINMGMSLTVEGAFDRSTLAVCSRKALRKMFTLLVPCAAAVAILAPWGLSLFGHQYAVHGAPVLELLAIATLPRAITEIYLGALRAQSRTSMVAAVQAARAVLMIGLAAILTSHMGAVGAAVAVVATQVVVAAVITVGLWRILVGDRIKGAPAGIGTAAR
jgi:O-antigen/teichoic acid export membrane protein